MFSYVEFIEFVQLTTDCCWGQPSDPCQRGCLTSHACVMWGPRTLNADDDEWSAWSFRLLARKHFPTWCRCVGACNRRSARTFHYILLFLEQIVNSGGYKIKSVYCRNLNKFTINFNTIEHCCVVQRNVLIYTHDEQPFHLNLIIVIIIIIILIL